MVQRISESGSYTANLLGNIRSHLAGLQGYDVMALELIQNADDAKAEEIIFDITDQGLVVENTGQFTYCGDLRNSLCGLIATHNCSCDFHRIADIGSGGKLSDGNNIGRFGIGFVSTYQVTDHPEIKSSGIKLSLFPERGQWFIETIETETGTSFFLPWAHDPSTEARLTLGISHVSESHIEQLTSDLQKVLQKSLLFLRHVRKAEVRHNGRLVLACDLERGIGSELLVRFRPSGEVEQWHILRVDASTAAMHLYQTYPHLEKLRRSTNISIGLRIRPKALEEGLFYAYLPTEQSTGLPVHINADFFPESDRKTLILAGHQHEQAWNEMLIAIAATKIAHDSEDLLRILGHISFWQILSHAYDLYSNPKSLPLCYKNFWERLKETGRNACIALAHDGSFQRPDGVFVVRGITLNDNHAKVLLEIGGRLVSDDLRSFQTAMIQMGSPILTFERLVSLLESTIKQKDQVDEDSLNNFYRPLWRVVNDLLPSEPSTSNVLIQRIKKVPLIVTEDLFAVTINQTYFAPVSLNTARIAALLPRLAIASHHLLECQKLSGLLSELDLGVVVKHLSSMCTSEPIEDFINTEPKQLHDLYSLFADLDRKNIVKDTVYDELCGLQIWQSSHGLIKATNALLPGNFTDPTGHADLLDTSVLSESAKGFLMNKLGVSEQTIEAFIQNVLPKFFTDNGPVDDSRYSRLITELSNSPSLINDGNIIEFLGNLRIVPTLDGGWSCPSYTYRRSEELVKVFGDSLHLWLDNTRIPNTRSVQVFIDSLGILRSPIARHLIDRMLFIAKERLPTEDAKRASSEAFYVLCDNYEEWKSTPAFQAAIKDLHSAACFPAEGDAENWYTADSLYAPYRAEAFRSQANILDFRNTGRLQTDLLKALDVTINPETKIVLDHLQHCITKGIPPHISTYQVLNERAQRGDMLIAQLAELQCIYVESLQGFIRPNRLYWSPQQLGRFALSIPSSLESFKPLFDAIGVKNVPDGHDLVDILIDIVGEHFEQTRLVTGYDRAIYDKCLAGISAIYQQDELEDSDLRRLQEAPTILNINGQPSHPDEVLLQDSEWHSGFFNGDLDEALCKPPIELWPIVEDIGVCRLSTSAHVTLQLVDGLQINEAHLANKIMDRKDILTRLLHDKPTAVRSKISNVLAQLTAVSYEVLQIQASVDLAGDEVFAPPVPTRAFYDIKKHQLVLSRPVNDQSWPHVLNAFFHQLMPEASGSEISKLTLGVRPLMGMSIEEAHQWLTEAGIPYLDSEIQSEDKQDLTSQNLDEMGDTSKSANHKDIEPIPLSAEDTVLNDEVEETAAIQSTLSERKAQHQRESSAQDRGQSEFSNTGHKPISTPSASGKHISNKSSFIDQRHKKTLSPKHKEQWNRRLLSYVRKNSEAQDIDDMNGFATEHNLGVEIIARDAVCSYEKLRGRDTEQMAQTHPGYDIISRNSLTGEERFIEVKGVNGEWNMTGVGLSRFQFSNAQQYEDRYWLYVVEFVGDPEQIRVHPIQSPASQVTSFMFDGNWRDAVTEEGGDPSLDFIVGARLNHQSFGLGYIVSREIRGATVLMSIEFDQGGIRKMPLNLKMMSLVEDNNDQDLT